MSFMLLSARGARAFQVFVATGLVCLGWSAVASAGTVSVSGSMLTYSAADGETNDLELSGVLSIDVTDTAGVVAVAPCAQVSATEADCPSGLTVFDVSLGDLSDAAVDSTVGSASAHFSGGEGDDQLTGLFGADVLLGGGGNDTLSGAQGNDELDGGSGDDQLEGVLGDDRLSGGPGADLLQIALGKDVASGGDGTDTADYSNYADPVTVTLDDVANDGAPGEADNIKTDVENVLGGENDDVLVGSAVSNLLDGRGGDDQIDSRDLVADTVICGSGTDTASTDALDSVNANCETIKTAPVDTDGDGVPDTSDNCSGSANADQANHDSDLQGDACDADDDNDGVSDSSDACPTNPASTASGCPPSGVGGPPPTPTPPAPVIVPVPAPAPVAPAPTGKRAKALAKCKAKPTKKAKKKCRAKAKALPL